MEYIVALFYSIGCGVMCGNIAKQKGYSVNHWIAAGFFFNIIAIIAIGFYKEIPKEEKKEFSFTELRKVMDRTT